MSDSGSLGLAIIQTLPHPQCQLAFLRPLTSSTLPTMHLNPAISRLAERMGLSLPLPVPSPADRAAFAHHLAALSEDAISLAPSDTQSLLLQIGDPLEVSRSEAKALDLAHAYGVPVYYFSESDWAALGAPIDTLGTCVAPPPPPGDGEPASHFIDIPPSGSLVIPLSGFVAVSASLGPEARAFVLWHELGHLVFGHPANTVPVEYDLSLQKFGWRSREYLANAFASIMMQETFPAAHLFGDATSRGYVWHFERGFEVLTNREAGKELDTASAVSRVHAFLRANSDLLLSKVAEVRQVGQGLRAAHRSFAQAFIPRDLQIFTWDSPPLRQETLYRGIPSSTATSETPSAAFWPDPSQ